MKKILSLAISLSLLASVNASAFEITNTNNKKVEKEFILNSESNIKLVDKIEFKSPPEMDIKDLVQSTSMPKVMGNKYSNINEGNLLGNMTAKSVTQSWTGVLKNEGEFTYVTATLAPTQILNATLICPKNPNLNYDLFVYEIDDNGYLTNLVSASTTGTYFNKYEDGITKTVDEGAAFVNKTSKTQNYAVIVSATKGGSASDAFELTLSLDVQGNYDAAEPNDSAYYAYKTTEGSISGATLHVSNDQDWYMWNATSEFRTAKISATAGYDVEVYTSDGSNLILTNKNSDGTYPIATGINYIKVFNNSSNFIPSAYTLSIEPWSVLPSSFQLTLDGDQGQDSYPEYPQGKGFRFKDKFSPILIFESKSHYPVRNYPVTLYWESGSWNEHTGNKTRTVTTYTDDFGTAIPTLQSPELPTALGYYSYYLRGPLSFIHYYDIDSIKIYADNKELTSGDVYHFSHSVLA